MKGFTVIELLVILAILGTLAAVVAINVRAFLNAGEANNATHNITVNTTERYEPFQICLDTECIVCTRWHKTAWRTSIGGN